MASELCDAQEVIHELLGTCASQNETEYNYRFGTPPMVATRTWRILNAARARLIPRRDLRYTAYCLPLMVATRT